MQRGVSSGSLPDDIEVSPGPQEESEATLSSDGIYVPCDYCPGEIYLPGRETEEQRT